MANLNKDDLWKAIIEDLFWDFCAYFFPQWTRQVADTTRQPEFLDKELSKIFPEAIGIEKRFADKVARVHTKTGTQQYVHVHIEVQGYRDKEFPSRMFTYFHRIKDRYGLDIMTLALLTDPDKAYHPKGFFYTYFGTSLSYHFQTFKLLEKQERELNQPGNPFSIVMLVARKALRKEENKDAAQLTWKRELIEALKQANYQETKIRHILHFIRMYVQFKKKDNEEKFNNLVANTFKHRKNMGIEELVTNYLKEKSFEEGFEKGRLEGVEKGHLEGVEKGIEKGRREGIEKGVEKGVERALNQEKLTIEEIAHLFDVSVDYVLKRQRGETGK